MRRLSLFLFVLTALQPGASAAPTPSRWVPSWTAATYPLDQAAQLSGAQLSDVTLRQGLRLSVGGKRLRIVLTNAAGDTPLSIAAVRIATAGKPGTSAIDPSSNRAVTFAGRADAVIQPGAEMRSDAIDFRAAPFARLAVTLQLRSLPARQTAHLRALTTS